MSRQPVSRRPFLGVAASLGFLWAVALAGALFPGRAWAGVEPIEEFPNPAGTYDPARFGKVAVVQWAPTLSTPLGASAAAAESFKQANRETLAGYIRTAVAAGAEWVVTPEFAVLGYPDIPELPPEEDEYRNREDIRPYVETVPGPSTEFFGQLARELHVYLHVGFAEVDPATDAYYNTVVAIDSSGQLAAKYRKANLFTGEGAFLSAGREPTTYVGPFGKVGLVICADVYSSFPMQNYLDAGVDVLALSTSWDQWNTGMDTFAAAARRDHAYLLAANQTYFPDSGVIGPDGVPQSHIRQSDGLAFGFLPRRGGPSTLRAAN